jgi:hypothetical protein
MRPPGETGACGKEECPLAPAREGFLPSLGEPGACVPGHTAGRIVRGSRALTAMTSSVSRRSLAGSTHDAAGIGKHLGMEHPLEPVQGFLPDGVIFQFLCRLGSRSHCRTSVISAVPRGPVLWLTCTTRAAAQKSEAARARSADHEETARP